MLNETVESLKKYVNGNRYYNVFEYNSEKMIILIDYMKDWIQKIMDDTDKKPKVSDGDKNNIINSTILMVNTISLKSLENDDKKFIEDYILLCFNFGKSFGISELMKNCEAISNLLQYQKSLIAQIEISKIQLTHMERYERFIPRVHDISKSYLENINLRML